MSDPPFIELPAAAFPIKMEFFREGTEELVHTIEITGPGAVWVPSRDGLWTRVTTSDGASSCSYNAPEEFNK